MRKFHVWWMVILVLWGAALPMPILAQGDGESLPVATIENDEGGIRQIIGRVGYTSRRFAIFSPDPYVLMFDLSLYIKNGGGFADRTSVPESAQVLGRVTSDPTTSPFTYELFLPQQPPGSALDLDNNTRPDPGVQVYMIALVSNFLGDPFVSEREFFSSYRSVQLDSDAIYSGKLLIYAAQADQGFPSGKGADGKLFTADDPAVRVPQGYTLVTLDTTPFSFSRPQVADVPLMESTAAAQDDFSQQNYVEAFDSLIALMRQKYAFTDYHNIDFDALIAEFRPRAEAAMRAQSRDDYVALLYALKNRFPDTHVSVSDVPDGAIRLAVAGAGIWAQTLDDGRVIVYDLPAQLPAAQAGIQVGAEILAVDNTPIAEAIRATEPFTTTGIATPFTRLILQQRDVFRGAPGRNMRITYRNPGDAQPTIAELTLVIDVEGLINYRPFYRIEKQERWLPIETTTVSGYTVLSFYDFSDDLPLTLRLWERAIRQAQLAPDSGNKPGLIIDLRRNGGGSSYVALRTAATFFNDKLNVGNLAEFDDTRDAFYANPREQEYLLPPPEAERYDGPVVVLVSPDCASACEFFTYYLTLQQRATVIGYYGTAGAGGSVVEVVMPDDLVFTYTRGRGIDANGAIHIEGKGIVPNQIPPITAEAVLSAGDPILDAAVAFLDAQPLPTQSLKTTLRAGSVTADLPTYWTASESGAYSPNREAEINFYLLNARAATVLNALRESATTEITKIETITLGSLEWTLYRFNTARKVETIALSELPQGLVLVELISPFDEEDYFTERVLKPVLDSLKIGR